jgi:hypothetical protein
MNLGIGFLLDGIDLLVATFTATPTRRRSTVNAWMA